MVCSTGWYGRGRSLLASLFLALVVSQSLVILSRVLHCSSNFTLLSSLGKIHCKRGCVKGLSFLVLHHSILVAKGFCLYSSSYSSSLSEKPDVCKTGAMTEKLEESKRGVGTNLKAKNKLAQRRHREKKKAEAQALQEQSVKLQAELEKAEHKKRLLQAEINALQLSLPNKGQVPSPVFASLEDVAVDFVPAQSWAGFDPIGGQSLVLTSIFDPPKRLTRAKFQTMTISEFCEFWQDLLLAAGQLTLESPDRNPHSPAGIKLKALTDDVCGFYSCLACWNPREYMRLQDVNIMNPAQRAEPLDMPVLKELIERLQLSEEQKRFLASCNHEAHVRCQQNLQERQNLKERVCEHELMMEPLQQHNYRRMVIQLYNNLVAEHILLDVVWRMLTVLPASLDSFQTITYLLGCWPRTADPFQFLRMVAEGELDASATESACDVKMEMVSETDTEEGSSPLLQPLERVVKEMMLAYNKCHVTEHLAGLEMSKAFANLKMM